MKPSCGLALPSPCCLPTSPCSGRNFAAPAQLRQELRSLFQHLSRPPSSAATKALQGCPPRKAPPLYFAVCRDRTSVRLLLAFVVAGVFRFFFFVLFFFFFFCWVCFRSLL